MHIILSLLLGFSFAQTPSQNNTAIASDLRTKAEKTNWIETGRADEVEKLCRAFALKYPVRVECKTYGKTPEGRDLKYMVIGGKTANKLPTVWLQAGIHAGEIDGKDAVFWLLRESLEGRSKSDPFAGVKVIFIPIVNLDGHERFGPWNRPNQVGPKEMGWRTTSQNYNMNRDFAKADSVEMQALLKLWNQMDPIVSLDLHVTNGAQFQPEVGAIILPIVNMGSETKSETNAKPVVAFEELKKAGSELEEKLMIKMKEHGRKALPFYPSFEKDGEPLSGFARYVSTPRFSQGYWSVRNRIGMLVETHSWKDYATRVKTHRDLVHSVLEIVKDQGRGWMQTASDLDRGNLSGSTVPITYKNIEKFKTIEFPGYKFTNDYSKISGTKVLKYQTDKPEIWKVPFYEELVADISVVAPKEGYWIPATEASWVSEKLKIHGIEFQVFRKSLEQDFEVFRASKTKFGSDSFEGHQTLTVEGEWKPEKSRVAAGSLFVPIKQKRGKLVLHLLEPRAPDSFLSWGLLNRYFEKKEYMEDYVAEAVATEMMKNPEIQKEFNLKMKDSEFAKDPEKRFDFFYQKHSSYDQNLNRYPILRR